MHGHNFRSEIITEVITIRGIVQGVGFRPTVYRIAQHLGMKGQVRNMGGVVQLICTGTREEIDIFIREINRLQPPMSQLSGITREVVGTTVFHKFTIGQSGNEEDEIALIPADIAICDECLHEFYDPENPRYLHPFISCTNCGPRYTIMNRLPYDRDTTAMDDFPMCDFCECEYTDPASRRYHAQTISCHDCGPQPILWHETGCRESPHCAPINRPSLSAFLSEAIQRLMSGGIIALKGVGGYYLICTPFDEQTIQRLRKIKRREQKPFAVMFNSIAQIRDYCVVGAAEETELVSPRRTIVLLEQRPSLAPELQALAPGVCNTSRLAGAFLPSFGLQYLLLNALGPLVMTSANLSELPLITNDNEMAEMAAREPLIDGILYNERNIAAGLDDSVARVVDGTVQLTRRSKGYVPSPVFIQSAETLTKETMLFATGAHLKSSFALSKGAYSYMSRHIGDLNSIEAETLYAEAFQRMKAFFEIEPKHVICDLHPRYFTTRFAKRLDLPLIHVQHHHAHIASVMAEHGLRGPVIGVGFDGTGYGTDGAIWGGEFLICEGTLAERFSHLAYTDMIGGDASMKDARKSAVSYICAKQKKPSILSSDNSSEIEIDLDEIMDYCERYETLLYDERGMIEAAINSNANTFRTSSMGRLFDAVSAMLGIHYENRYEGECAILLENAAERAKIKLRLGDSPTEQERLALAFHDGIARTVLIQCRLIRDKYKISDVCLSGGVFQNKLLTEETLRLLRGDNFTVYYNIHVPPNDGGIALGQNYIGMMSVAAK